MNALLFLAAVWIALLAWILNTKLYYPVVYACSEVTKNDPIDVQQICEQERKGKWWMN